MCLHWKKGKVCRHITWCQEKGKKMHYLIEQFLGCVCVGDSVWVLVQSNKDDSDIQKAIVDDNKGSLAAASITFLLVSVLNVNVFSILFRGWVTMVTWPRRLLGLRTICPCLLTWMYVEVQGKYWIYGTYCCFRCSKYTVYLHITLLKSSGFRVKSSLGVFFEQWKWHLQ